MEQVIILDSIRSTHNVGSIFRTCDGAGVSKLYLGGYTPAPIDRFGRVVPEVAKTSLGATATVLWEQVPYGGEAALSATLKAAGYYLVAVEQVAGATMLPNFEKPEKVAFILGNEVEGVSADWLALADEILEIPMRGHKESLNVSVCAGIVLFAR